MLLHSPVHVFPIVFIFFLVDFLFKNLGSGRGEASTRSTVGRYSTGVRPASQVSTGCVLYSVHVASCSTAVALPSPPVTTLASCELSSKGVDQYATPRGVKWTEVLTPRSTDADAHVGVLYEYDTDHGSSPRPPTRDPRPARVQRRTCWQTKRGLYAHQRGSRLVGW